MFIQHSPAKGWVKIMFPYKTLSNITQGTWPMQHSIKLHVTDAIF